MFNVQIGGEKGKVQKDGFSGFIIIQNSWFFDCPSWNMCIYTLIYLCLYRIYLHINESLLYTHYSKLWLFLFKNTYWFMYWFCHTLTWIYHRCTCVPKHEPPSYLPPHNVSLGHPCAPAPSMLYLASDIDWQFDSYIIVYMLECHSPKSSHPLPLPQSPKDGSIHLCLFCCFAYWVIITIFLNCIYMC